MKRTAVLLGSKPAAVVALAVLVSRGWDVTEVVAAPDERDWLPGPNLHRFARMLGIRTVDHQSKLNSSGVDLVISYMHRKRVQSETRQRGRYPLNFHAAPLPEYGGYAFYNLAILENAVEYGCTCHIMDEGFDTGPLVKVRRFPINPKAETAVSLEGRTQAEMLLLFEEVLALYESEGALQSVGQDREKMRYLTAGEFAALKQIPATATRDEVDMRARAFWYPPYDLAYLSLENGTRIEVVPDVVKKKLAEQMHENDLRFLVRSLSIETSLRRLLENQDEDLW